MQNAPAIFVFIPFCKTVCTYCDFNVYAHLGKLFETYTNALAQEIARTASDIPTPRRAGSLALGGGTPSILPTPLLQRIFGAVYQHFELVPGAEVTLEANPGTVDRDKLRALRDLGVNRLSLGVQTFDDARLKAFNRRHTAAESREAFDLARSLGFDNLNLDLIFGLPDQALDDWAQTLDRALAWQPEHLSLYGLQVEEGTALARQIARGRVHEPAADLAADMFLLAHERLTAAGFEHYEISNYARPGHQSRHNLTYWLNQPYLGFGAGAHSFFRGERYANLCAPAEYIARIANGESVVATREPISREIEIGDTLMLGLRLERGIVFEEYRARFGEDVRDRFGETIKQLTDWGFMEVDAERMHLVTRGRLVSNQLLWRFLPDEDMSDSPPPPAK
ncbi:MAG: radical SAM family heme chaperone HemW [Anaerolineae bacterium]